MYATEHEYAINSISLSSDGEYFLTSDDLVIHMWHASHTTYVVPSHLLHNSSLQDPRTGQGRGILIFLTKVFKKGGNRVVKDARGVLTIQRCPNEFRVLNNIVTGMRTFRRCCLVQGFPQVG